MSEHHVCPKCSRDQVVWDARCLHYRCLYEDCDYAAKEIANNMTITTPWSDTPPSEKNVEFWVQHRRTGRQSIGKRISFREWLIDGQEEFMPERYFQFGPRVLDAEDTVALTAEVERLREDIQRVREWRDEAAKTNAGTIASLEAEIQELRAITSPHKLIPDARDMQFRRLQEENANLRELLCQNAVEIRELRAVAVELAEIKRAWGVAGVEL